MTGTRTLEVVHGLSDDLKVVRNGRKPYRIGNQTTNKTLLEQTERRQRMVYNKL